jgi:hypothetical protein
MIRNDVAAERAALHSLMDHALSKGQKSIPSIKVIL